MTECKKAKTKTMKNVDHSSDTGVLAERYDTTTVLVHHSLVVDQTNILHTTTHATLIP